MSEIDQPDENDINEISKKSILIWEKIIRKGRKLAKTMIDVRNIKYNKEDNNPIKILKLICREMMI